MKHLKIRTLLIISFLAVSLIPLFALNYFYSTMNFTKEVLWTISAITSICATLLAFYISYIITKPIYGFTEKACQIEDLQEKMIAQEKLATIGLLTAGIVHEIKNPLNFINNFSELGQNQLGKMQDRITAFSGRLDQDDKDQLNKIVTTLDSNLKKIRQHGMKANSIICRMLEQARSGIHKDFKSTDINALLEEHFKLAYHAKRSQDPSFNIQMEMDFDKDLGEILVLPLEIGQVTLNMLNNAFYAVCEKKKISGDDYMPVVAITTRKEGQDKVAISFYDNGIGIPQEVRERMYDSFFTTKPPGEGTGLGLALSREAVVSAHHGEIQVDSKPGEFTVFTIILPLRNVL